MTSMVPGSHIEVGSPTTIRISSQEVADGCSLLAVTHAMDEHGRYVSGFDNALRLKPNLLQDDHVIPAVPEGILIRIVLIGLSGTSETRIGDVTRPTIHVDKTARADPTDALDRRMSLAGSIYRRNGTQRFRFVDQGWTEGYASFSRTSGFEFSIPEIVAALDSHQASSPTRKPNARKSGGSGSTGSKTARIMDLTYKAALGGTSFRRIVIVSASADRIRAREADGSQVKTFLTSGIIDLCDSETGEDLLTLLRAMSDVFVN
jgi:hypothetical protein